MMSPNWAQESRKIRNPGLDLVREAGLAAASLTFCAWRYPQILLNAGVFWLRGRDRTVILRDGNVIVWGGEVTNFGERLLWFRQRDGSSHARAEHGVHGD
jgi:hypothetical protein